MTKGRVYITTLKPGEKVEDYFHCWLEHDCIVECKANYLDYVIYDLRCPTCHDHFKRRIRKGDEQVQDTIDKMTEKINKLNERR